MGGSGQKDAFAARLERIRRNEGGGATLLCGVGGDALQTGTRGARASVQVREQRGVADPLKVMRDIALAFGFGAATMLIGHVASFHFQGAVMAAGELVGLQQLKWVDIALVAFVLMLLLPLFNLVRRTHIACAVVGAAAIMTQEITLLRAFPEVWAQLYSTEFVDTSLQAGKLLLPEIATSFALI